MKLLTKQNLADFKKQGYTDGKPKDQVKVIVKFFNPTGAGNWYAVEYDENERMFFGFVSIFNDHCDELGYFSLDELESYRGMFGLGIERDMHFGDHTLQEVLDGARP